MVLLNWVSWVKICIEDFCPLLIYILILAYGSFHDHDTFLLCNLLEELCQNVVSDQSGVPRCYFVVA